MKYAIDCSNTHAGTLGDILNSDVFCSHAYFAFVLQRYEKNLEHKQNKREKLEFISVT